MSELKRYKASEFMWNSDVYYIIEADKYIAHQKRKRCLAMAQWCMDKVNAIKNGYIKSQNGVMTTCPPECNPKFSFYSKWYKRWLALAEEPTWAKFLQLIHKEAK